MDAIQQRTKPTGMTETGLKWIALAAMVLDHVHYFFGFTGWIPEWFSMAGRIGAPLFLFCLVEGFTHTAQVSCLFEEGEKKKNKSCFISLISTST